MIRTVVIPLLLFLGIVQLFSFTMISAEAVFAEGPLHPSPRLVGYGCVGSSVPLYRDAEDDFPVCDRILASEGR